LDPVCALYRFKACVLNGLLDDRWADCSERKVISRIAAHTKDGFALVLSGNVGKSVQRKHGVVNLRGFKIYE